MDSFINWLDMNISQPLSVDSLAEMNGISTSRFRQKFVSHTGIAIGTYINIKRLESAAFLLKISDKSISDIGIKSGFSSGLSFSKKFTRYFGISPTQYRNCNNGVIYKTL